MIFRIVRRYFFVGNRVFNARFGKSSQTEFAAVAYTAGFLSAVVTAARQMIRCTQFAAELDYFLFGQFLQRRYDFNALAVNCRCFAGVIGKFLEFADKFRTAVRNAGGLAVKFVSPGLDGMPDRLALLPGGRMAFVEVKAPGKKPRPLQEARHRLLRRLGFQVYVLDDEKQIGGIIDEIQSP